MRSPFERKSPFPQAVPFNSIGLEGDAQPERNNAVAKARNMVVFPIHFFMISFSLFFILHFSAVLITSKQAVGMV